MLNIACIAALSVSLFLPDENALLIVEVSNDKAKQQGMNSVSV